MFGASHARRPYCAFTVTESLHHPRCCATCQMDLSSISGSGSGSNSSSSGDRGGDQGGDDGGGGGEISPMVWFDAIFFELASL